MSWRRSPWLFFLIAIGFSWLFWLPAAFVEENILDSAWVLLLYAGGIGPGITGIILTYINEDTEGQKAYWRRVFSLTRIGWPWYSVVLFSYPLITLLVLLTGILQGQHWISETLGELLQQPIQLVPFLVFILVFGPFPEELGWRGYALDPLQRKMNALSASLLLGSIWALWHLPLFFMNGTYQNELGFGTAAFWRFCIAAVVFSIFITWVYNNSQRSILSAILFHFSANLTGNLFVTNAVQETWRILLMIVFAFIVIHFFGYRDLSTPRARVEPG